MDQQQPEVTIKAVDSGPYQVKGPVRLVDHDGKVFDIPARRSVLLCRCGRSATKPLCDGAHARTGFQAHERA
ncbi:CDGSH iron-sulfur domain-containing protein [Saccharothrix saharensis]|uniref:CDGSH iron-sulfur domain-containing protein n=1 Tax=Saccharothrix saharensis TaxID=571190 RepID=UPI0036A15ADF